MDPIKSLGSLSLLSSISIIINKFCYTYKKKLLDLKSNGSLRLVLEQHTRLTKFCDNEMNFGQLPIIGSYLIRRNAKWRGSAASAAATAKTAATILRTCPTALPLVPWLIRYYQRRPTPQVSGSAHAAPCVGSRSSANLSTPAPADDRHLLQQYAACWWPHGGTRAAAAAAASCSWPGRPAGEQQQQQLREHGDPEHDWRSHPAGRAERDGRR